MKIEAKKFFDENLKNIGLIVGTPCSFFKGFQNEAINRNLWLNTANEGSAVSLATGYNMMQTDKQCLTIFQSSGIGNAVSPLTSLNYPFEQPINIFVSHRTEEPGEDQHKLMSKIDEKLLDLSGCLVSNINTYTNPILSKKHVNAYMVPKGAFEMVELEDKETSFLDKICPIKKYFDYTETEYIEELNSRYSQIESIVKVLESQNEPYIIIGTTGMTSRELCDIRDNEHNLYMCGSMGHASMLGMGMALARPDIKVIVIDGDAALQMHMGNMTTIGAVNPKNLIHILLDNNMNDTTGGQKTDCECNWTQVAISSNYNKVYKSYHVDIALYDALKDDDVKGASFIYVPIKPGSQKVGRPSLNPTQVKERLQEYVKSI